MSGLRCSRPQPAGDWDDTDLSLLATAFDAVDDGLIVLDEAGGIVATNAAALRELRYGEGGLVGRHISLVLPGPFADSFAAGLGQQDRLGTCDHSTELGIAEAVRRDGTAVPVRVVIKRLTHGGGSYYLCICRSAATSPHGRSPAPDRARRDRATGCLNRFGLEEHLAQLIGARPDGGVAIAYVDLDGLGAAGDCYPSSIEFGLVRQAVARLRGALEDNDEVARVGRQEFVVVVAFAPDGPGISELAHRLDSCLQAPLEAGAWRVAIRASMGISLYPEHARSPEKLVDLAEAAMRTAKRSPVRQPTLHSLQGQRRNESRDDHMERVRAAVEARELTLHFQPQFDLMTLQTTGLEALLRWQRPGDGIASPAAFLSLLSEWGLMPAVSRWVLRQAVAVNTRLLADGLLDVPVAVNVDAEMFESPGFVSVVAEVLDELGMAADRLELEITEATAISDMPQVAANARSLRARGVGIAIDDYGTGFSSLARLRSVDFSKLKIDRTFVSLLPGDRGDQAVIAALLRLADELDLQAVAEGIETEEQLGTLRTLGCRYGQGYWYGRPMPEDVLRAWIGSVG